MDIYKASGLVDMMARLAQHRDPQPSLTSNPQPQSPKPQTPNSKPQAPNPKPQTRKRDAGCNEKKRRVVLMSSERPFVTNSR